MKKLLLGFLCGVTISVACSMGKKTEYVERRENQKMWEFGAAPGEVFNQTCADPKQKKDGKCKDWKKIWKNVCNETDQNWFKSAGYVLLPWDYLKI